MLEIPDKGLGAGDRLEIRGTSRAGIVGLMVADGRGICAVTAASLLDAARGRRLVDQVDWEVGSPQPVKAPHEQQSAEDLLGLIRIHRQTYVSADIPGFPSAKQVMSPFAALGSRVWKVSPDGLEEAVLTRIYSCFYLGLPDGGRRRIDNAFELVPEQPAAFAGPGDGGALIMSVYGAPIGILIAADDEGCFAAPLGDWLAECGLVLLDPARAAEHNQGIRNVAFDFASMPKGFASLFNPRTDGRDQLKSVVDHFAGGATLSTPSEPSPLAEAVAQALAA